MISFSEDRRCNAFALTEEGRELSYAFELKHIGDLGDVLFGTGEKFFRSEQTLLVLIMRR